MATIRSVIRGVIREATIDAFELSDIAIPEDKIIFSHGNGLEPNSNYCVINILENRQKGRASESTRTKEGATWEQQSLPFTVFYYAKVQFSFIGKDALDVGMEFQNNVTNNRQVIEAYQYKSLSPVNKTDLKRLPKLRETDWVETTTIDLDFGYSVQRYQDINWIEYIVVNGNTFRIVDDPIEEP
jgi:hypothetical protein